MPSWLLLIHLTLLLSAVLVQARYRAHSKRRYSISTPSSPTPNLLADENQPVHNDERNDMGNDQSWIDVMKEEVTPSTTARTSTSPPTGKHQANELQVEQFTRLLFERLNLREPPNVTANVSEATGFPSSIVKQLEQQAKEQQYLHHKEEENHYRQQKIHDEIMPTAERAILPGDHILHHSCQRQLAAKLNLGKDELDNIDCFRFTKSTKETSSLPSNQLINELRIYMRKSYFHLPDGQEKVTPDMFQIYQVFRPTSNDTTHTPPFSLTDTIRISLSHVKDLNEHWFELIVEPNQQEIDIQQLYRQIIMPWYGLAIDRDLQSASSSLIERSLPASDRQHYRQYHAKKHLSPSNNQEETDEASQHQLPYILVEYGEKIAPASTGNRGARSATPRPARGCSPTSLCCRRSLTIDLDQGSNALNFVIYPRQLDIGECVGLCGLSGSSLKHTEVKNAQYKNEQNSAYNLLLLQNGLHFNRSTTTTQVNRPDQHSPQCCSYSRTGGLELMYTTTNGGPIIRKFIPNMVVEECKCGLPATIQQV